MMLCLLSLDPLSYLWDQIKNMLVHKSNPESIPTPLHSETVNIVDTYMYMVVETNEFAREYRVRKN